MTPFWRSLLFWTPFARPNLRRLADNIKTEEIIDLTLDDDDEPAPGRALNGGSRYECPICMSDVQSPVATYCGHVFCSECIQNAFNIRKVCPLCNKEGDGFIRLYWN